jgi:Ser/Thr protein kinase RdoA (MazF antagonist)
MLSSVQHIDEVAARVVERSGVDRLPAHLESTYGVRVSKLAKLDLGVFRVDRRGGPSWVARVFPAARPLELAHGDAEILRGLDELGYPAERVAAPEPVSVLDGQAVLVTEHVPSVPRDQRRAAFRDAGGLRAVGELLARLSPLEPPAPAFSREGGAWHHLADGLPSAEIGAARAMLDEAGRMMPPGDRADFDVLRAELEAVDDGAGLPIGLIHPDFVVPNIVASRDRGLVVVDWAGAGRAPRAWALAFLLWSVGHAGDLRRVDRAVDGYRRHVRLEPGEASRLPALLRARPVMFDVWAFCMGRKSLEEAASSARESGAHAGAIAERARVAFER